jgi:hypothetical protein
MRRMPSCEYPPCVKPATQSRGLVVEPEFIAISLCAHHAAVIDRNRGDEDPDFWRWAMAMMESPGSG